jgi:fatty-acyl-CoA synthase
LCGDCRPSILVCDDGWLSWGKRLQEEGKVPQTISLQGVGIATIAESGAPPDFKAHAADPEEIAMILYTSGTTGKSKGAMISWRQIHWNAINTTIGLALTENDVSFLNTPLYHTGGWHVLFTPLMHLGGRVVLQRQFDPAVCNELIEREHITILFGIPTTMRLMLEAPNFSEADFSSLRFAICGGEPCPVPILHAYQKKGVPVRQGYGLTEAGPNCFSLPAEDALRKEGSVGFPNFHIETRIERENGSEAGPGEVGELLMRGPHVFSGYWNNPEATKETLTNGWVRTGDLFKRDTEGFHTVVGRKKDMFISGGENVYPAQVERILHDHPAIAQVSVVSVPDSRWGETGCACVVLKPGEKLDSDALQQWGRKYLAAFQCPRHIIQLDALPLGPSGKVDKRALERLARPRELTDQR